MFNSTNYIITTYQTNDNVILLSATDVALLYHGFGIQEAKSETTYRRLQELGLAIQPVQYNKQHSTKYDNAGAYVFMHDANGSAGKLNDVVLLNIRGVNDYIGRSKDRGVVDRRASFIKALKIIMDCENITL